VNGQHFKAFVWLRWRLRVNQLKKGGVANVVVLALLAAVVVVAAVGLSVGCFLAGLLIPVDAPPGVRLYVWDGLVVAYLFVWMIGLLNDLQRSESLSLEKFLHLPVSPAGVFLVNYLSSLVSITGVLFVPAMFALALGQTAARGWASLLVLPVVAAFYFAVTAVTYQFQGWLAGLMSNPRRRRTIVVFITLGFILVAQLPNVLNLAFIRPWEGQVPSPDAGSAARQAELSEAVSKGRLTPEEYLRRSEEIQKEEHDRKAGEDRRKLERIEGTARLVNLAVPPGWLPLGAAAAADGSVGPALLASLGFTAVGSFSLWRAYRTTIGLYTGRGDAGDRRPAARASPARPDRVGVRMTEWVLPRVPEPAAAVALAGFQSLLRAPEAKMALLTPLIFFMVFGGVFATVPVSPPASVRPLIALGAVAMVMLTGAQLTGNQFGYDRSGFRAFVLSPVPRRDILLGKNLAVAPFTLGGGLAMVVLVACVYPMRFDHLLAVLALVPALYLTFSLLANVLSIAAPIPMAAGSFKPATIKFVPVLLQMLFIFAFPVVLLPLLAPLGAEVLLVEFGGPGGVPVALVLSLALLAVVVWGYRRVLALEGDWLASREQRILEAVTAKEE